MSQENVELTLLLFDAFNRRDVDAAVALFDEEGAWRNGKCLEVRTWLSHAEALEPAGLRE